jgi:glycosyltransferase involved in cell wall biosynthesis
VKKILVFSFFPAFVPPTNGGQSRLFNFYKALSESFEITLLTSTHVGVEEEVVNHGVGFVERRIPKDQFFTSQSTTLSQYSGGGDLSGPCIAACGKSPTLLHQAYLEEYERADVIVHDSPFTVEYDLFAGLDNKFRVYNAYNCETQLYRQLHEGAKSQQIHEIVRQAELRMLEASDLLLYCGQDDLVAFREMAPDAKCEAVYAPNGMTPFAVQPRTGEPSQGALSAVFMGSGHPPNAHAAVFIVRTLAPRLPEITFDIIGSCLPEGKYPPNVRRHGVVSDESKSRLLSQASLALNPMESGSGSNVKVLDYLSYGLPVLSTTFGMRGIQAEAGREYLEASLEEFPEAIRAAAGNRDALSAVAAAGNALALARYTWEAIARSTAQNLEKLAEAKAAAPSKRFVLALNDYDSFEGVGGGGTRTRGLYSAVSEWSPVVFICFSSNGNLQARKFAEGITVINVPKTPDHMAELRRVNSRFRVSADDIIASRHCLANPYLNVVYRVLRQSARCIVVEHCYMTGLPRAWGDRFVYSSQNNETELKTRLLEQHPLKSELLQDVERIERFAVGCSAAAIAVSQEDAESLVWGKRTAGPVIVVRNGAAAPEIGEAVTKVQEILRNKISDRSVVFLGSAHMPNIDAARHITEQIAPQCTDVQFHIMGPVCSTLDKVSPNVHLWGVVDDVTKSAVMQSSALAINPMLSGSGSNVKLADYLGNGLYVVTTEFGQRGYPTSILEHAEVVPIERFAGAIQAVLSRPELFSADARQKRRDLFDRELAMQGLAGRFVSTLQGLEEKKKRVLYVAYRYISPPQGGAEVNIEKFVSALGHSGHFDVDVVAPEISGIHNHMRFSESYSFDPESSAPVDIPNVRFARFPAGAPQQALIDRCLRSAWRAQPSFERAVSRRLANDYAATGLAWGWGYPEGETGFASRWAFTECGIFLADPSQIQVAGYTPAPVMITAQSHDEVVAGPWSVEGNFRLDFQAGAGELEFISSAPSQKHDPRPIGFRLTQFTVAGKAVDLAAPTLAQRHLPNMAAGTTFQILDQAAAETRVAQNVRLTDGRGPWSASLERFIADYVAEYDLVVTHNNVFRPAVVAIEEAKKHGVPSILIPHAHLDDDFYHFPDLLESARNASLVLAVPRVAVDFLASKGCNARYLPAGCDTREEFSPQDVEAFRQVSNDARPFVLVLGRKAGAKGYRKIIDAVEQLNRGGIDLHAVLIGPDDDGVPVDSPNASYLGRQPRNVVRGALMSCVALCNMSTSESFGIVLLEAWLAGKPVVVNKNCAAFHDMAVDGVNALMVGEVELPEAIRELVSQPGLRARLAGNGATITDQFDWAAVSEKFLDICKDLPNKKGSVRL